MIRALWTVASLALFISQGHASGLVDAEPKDLPPALEIEDDAGRSHALNEFRGLPLIVVPIYSHCDSTCPLIINQLTHDLPLTHIPTDQYRVLLFSFDPSDQASDLKMMREMHSIPPFWIIAHASSKDTELLMSALGVRTVFDPKLHEFSHPDLLVTYQPGLTDGVRLRDSAISDTALTQSLTPTRTKALSNEIFEFGLLPFGILGSLLCSFGLVHMRMRRKKLDP